MSIPTVSVVMSVYNGAEYLPRSVESILAQEGVDFEFIIVNDGSTDDSGTILARYTEQDRRIRVIDQQNLGLTRALIRGCREARGKYIARQDADDISGPGRLAALAEFLNQNTEVVLAFSWVRILAPDGDVIEQVNPSSPIGEVTRKLREELVGIPAHGSVMFRREAYQRAGEYRKEFYYAQDCDLWLRLAWEGKTGCVNDYLYDFYQTTGGISSSRRELQGQFADIAQDCYWARRRNEPDGPFLAHADEVKRRAMAAKDRKTSRRSAATTYYLMGASLAARENRRAITYYSRAIQTWPFSARFWLGIVTHYVRRWKWS